MIIWVYVTACTLIISLKWIATSGITGLTGRNASQILERGAAFLSRGEGTIYFLNAALPGEERDLLALEKSEFHAS